jgi:ketosteroid isomerase-like protein
MSNLQTVQDIYAAFGRGDIAAILNQLHEDIAWDHGMSDTGVPWLQPRTGRAEIPKFFEALGALDFKKFQPKTLLESGNMVVALIDLEFVIKANGRAVSEENEVHIWHFDSQGLATRFCHKIDTHKQWVAYRGE